MCVLCCQWRLAGLKSLVVADVPEPVPGPGEIAISVRAAALNFFDTLIINDRYQHRPLRPFSPCGECAGIVSAIGPGVTAFQKGDRVAAYTGWGAGRQTVVCAAAKAVHVPDSVSLDHAAGVLITYGTSLYALDQRAGLAAGETLAVLGAAGGVGLAAVEIGASMGARVIACASSDEKVAFAMERGAVAGINTATQDVKARLKALAGPEGLDVVYDAVGGDLVDPAIRATGWCGRYLVVGFAGGEIPKLALNLVLLKSVDVMGVFWGAWTDRAPQDHARNVARIFAMIAEGKLRPHIHADYPLQDFARAYDDISSRRVVGKVILRP